MKSTLIPILMMLVISSSCKESSNPLTDIHAPAYYYGAVSQDSILYSYSSGKLNIGSETLVDERSQFALFSITKTFTAIAIMQLVESGKIQLDSPAARYLPQYKFLGQITVRHLMTHQSGINNPLPTSWIHLAEEDDNFDFAAFNNEVLSKAKIKSKPGKKASYSNLNFILLGEIISSISGISYQEYVETHVLNTTDIGFSWKDSNTVTGYHDSGFQGLVLRFLLDRNKYTEEKTDGYIPFKKINLNGSAHGGLLASPNGMNAFLMEFLKNDSKILSEKMKNSMFEEQNLADGEFSGHSLGWFTGSIKGVKYAHHPGGGGGFYLELRVYPDKGVATFVLTNKSGFSDKRLLDKLDSHFLGF